MNTEDKELSIEELEKLRKKLWNRTYYLKNKEKISTYNNEKQKEKRQQRGHLPRGRRPLSEVKDDELKILTDKIKNLRRENL